MRNHTLKYLEAKCPRGRVRKGLQSANCSAEIVAMRSIPVLLLPAVADLLRDIQSFCFPEHAADWYQLSWKGKLDEGELWEMLLCFLPLLCQPRVSLAPAMVPAGMNPLRKSIDEGQEWMSSRFCYRSSLLRSLDQATFLINKPWGPGDVPSPWAAVEPEG